MKVGIIIVCYNGLKYLPALFTSLDKNAPGQSIYLVDNASTDGSSDYVRRSWPRINILNQDKNLGFAEGNNIGITKALADGVEAVWLLNQDTEVLAGCLDKLTEILESDEQLGAVSPLLKLPSGKVNSLGNCYHYLGFAYAGGNGLSYDEAVRRLPWINRNTEPPYLTGASMLIKSAVFKKIGLLDQELFMYHEDLEFCLRLRQAGYKLKVVTDAEVIHYYVFSSSVNKFYFLERNRLLVWLAYLKLPTIIILFLPLIIAELAIIFTSLINGWFNKHWQAVRFLFTAAGRQYIRAKRIQIKKIRTHTDRYLLSFAVGTIEFQEKNPWYVKYIFNPISNLMWLVIKQFIWW